MSRGYWVGATVPGRKAKLNPQTYSGHPMWNTFQGLGIKSTARDANQGRKMSRSRGRKKRLAKDNLCHRANHIEIKYDRDINLRLLDKIRRLSLQIDHLAGAELELAQVRYTNLLGQLDHKQKLELIRLETARGVKRAILAA